MCENSSREGLEYIIALISKSKALFVVKPSAKRENLLKANTFKYSEVNNISILNQI